MEDFPQIPDSVAGCGLPDELLRTIACGPISSRSATASGRVPYPPFSSCGQLDGWPPPVRSHDLLAKTRQEQLDFGQHFDRWLGIRRPSKRAGLAASIARQSSPVLIATLVSLGFIAVLIIGRLTGLGGPSQPIPTDPGGQLPPAISRVVNAVGSLRLADAIRAGALIPLAVFVGWLLLRWRRRILWLDTRAKGGQSSLIKSRFSQRSGTYSTVPTFSLLRANFAGTDPCHWSTLTSNAR